MTHEKERLFGWTARPQHLHSYPAPAQSLKAIQNVGHHAASPFAALDCASNRAVAFAAGSEDAPFKHWRCTAQSLQLARSECTSRKPCSLLLSAALPTAETYQLPLSAHADCRPLSSGRIAPGKVAAEDCQHRCLPATAQTHRQVKSKQSTLGEFNAWWRDGGPPAVVCLQSLGSLQEQ